jgi:radical SAM superfamily enzyme YgiQ (UPF0313 family)
MRVLLVQPPKAPATIGGEDIFIYEPLALEYLAAGVRANHDVRILDMRLPASLAAVLEEFRPDVVGITAYTVHVNVVRRLFAEVKAWNPRTLTVAGGHHATVAPQDFAAPSIDLVVRGEGVDTFREIVERLERGQGYEGIPGLGEPCMLEDLDAVPFPDRQLTGPDRPHYYSEWMKPLASIRTSKGCPYRCSFCAEWKLAGGRYWKRRPEKVVEELAAIAEPFVFFADDESLVDAPRMKALAEAIRDAGIKKRYFLYGRTDTIARHPELVALWKSVGLERVFVGFEFFRDQDLAFIRKSSTVADSEKAASVLADLDIEVYASFIVRPEFTREDFAALRPYCRKLKLRFATFAVLTPLPGTDFRAQVEDQLITRNYDLVDFIHTLLPTALPLPEFYERMHWLYTKAIPRWKQLPLLARLPLREIPATLAKSARTLERLRTAYKDYEKPGVTP